MFEYGYIIYSRGESRRIVLGTVDSDEYDSKQREIDQANSISSSSGRYDGIPDGTVWFIDEIP